MDMPHMLAYTLHGTFGAGNRPTLAIGAAGKVTWLFPENGQDDSYWICIIDAKNPKQKVKDWVVPGKNAAVPPGIDTYMNNPDCIFALATQNLSTLHVPHGPFYDFLAKYGADRELQKLEQFNAVLGCGTWGRVAYCLTTHCGPRETGKPKPASYELGDHVTGTILMMSLMPQKNGAPPYGLCDSYTLDISITRSVILRSRALARRLEGWPRAPVAHPSRLAVKNGEHLRVTAVVWPSARGAS